MTEPSSETYYRDSEVFLTAEVAARVSLTMPVEISLTGSDGVHDWLASDWIGTAGTTREAQTTSVVVLDEATYPEDVYQLMVRAVGTEKPILLAGYINLV